MRENSKRSGAASTLLELVDAIPEDGRGRIGGKWIEILMPLTKHARKWAKITPELLDVGVQYLVTAINRGTIRLPPGQWEAARREGVAYVRYLGP